MQLKKAGELRRNDRIRYHGNELIVTRTETFPGDWEEDPATHIEAIDRPASHTRCRTYTPTPTSSRWRPAMPDLPDPDGPAALEIAVLTGAASAQPPSDQPAEDRHAEPA